MSDTYRLFPPFGDPWPSCLLPSERDTHCGLHGTGRSLQLQHSLLWGDKESTSYSGNEQQVGSLVTMETRRPHPSWPLRLNTLMGQRSLLIYQQTAILKWPEYTKGINKRMVLTPCIYLCILSNLVVSHFLWPHGLYPTRLLCPWYFPCKNIEVDFHFLLQSIFPTHGLNPCLLHWQENSLPLSHLGIHTPSLVPKFLFCHNLSGMAEQGVLILRFIQSSLVAQTIKNSPAIQKTWVRTLSQEDPPKKEMTNHSSILAWRIPWQRALAG